MKPSKYAVTCPACRHMVGMHMTFVSAGVPSGHRPCASIREGKRCGCKNTFTTLMPPKKPINPNGVALRRKRS